MRWLLNAAAIVVIAACSDTQERLFPSCGADGDMCDGGTCRDDACYDPGFACAEFPSDVAGCYTASLFCARGVILPHSHPTRKIADKNFLWWCEEELPCPEGTTCAASVDSCVHGACSGDVTRVCKYNFVCDL